MSRFDFDGYDEHTITWEMQQWNLQRHLASLKGQAKLREFRDALLAMPDRCLISSNIATLEGDVCAIGAYAAYKLTQSGKSWMDAVQEVQQRYQPVTGWGWQEDSDPFTTMDAGVTECGLTRTLAWELAYRNDETFSELTPEQRWQRMHDWVCGLIRDEVTS